MRWTTQFDGVADVAVGSETVAVAAGTRLLSIGTDGSRLGAFDAAEPARSVRVGEETIVLLSAIDNDRSVVRGLTLSATRRWERRLAVSEVLLDGTRLYAGGWTVAALDLDGSVAWQDDANGGWLLLAPDADALFTRVGGSSVGAYSLPDGDASWRFDPEEQYAWPSAATGVAVIAEGYADGRAIYAVDRKRGTVRRRYGFGRDGTIFDVATSSERVFVGDGASSITAFDT